MNTSSSINTSSSMNRSPLAEFLATQPDGTLEQIAQDYQVSVLDVVRALPERVLVGAEHFDRIWDSMTEWGDVTTLVHTADVIWNTKAHYRAGLTAMAISIYAVNKASVAISEHKIARQSPCWNAHLWEWQQRQYSFQSTG